MHSASNGSEGSGMPQGEPLDFETVRLGCASNFCSQSTVIVFYALYAFYAWQIDTVTAVRHGLTEHLLWQHLQDSESKVWPRLAESGLLHFPESMCSMCSMRGGFFP